MPGSHVIVKSEGRELTDATFEDAARLAAYYSRAKGQSKIEVDYTQKKMSKSPAVVSQALLCTIRIIPC